jgi:hypothetical protein
LAEFSSFLVFFEVDFPLFHFIIFARRLCIIISFVKYICSLLLPYVTLTTLWCLFFNNIFTVIRLYINLLILRWHFYISC